MFSRRVKPRFDKCLRERHPAWGIGLLADLLAQAELAPFSQVFVTITQQDHIELRLAAQQWQRLHCNAVIRYDQQEVRHDRIVRELKAEALKSNAAFRAELDLALAQVRDLQKRLFSSKSEQSKPSESRSKAATCRKREQQRGMIGHGHTIEAKLSERHKDIDLDKAQSPECGLAFKEFAGTEGEQVPVDKRFSSGFEPGGRATKVTCCETPQPAPAARCAHGFV